MGHLRRYGAHWTPSEDATLRDLAASGYSWADAAEELGRTEWGVKCRAPKAGARFRQVSPRYDPHTRAAVLDAIREGLPQKAIAERIDRPIERVCVLVRELIGRGLVRRTGRKRSVKLFVVGRAG